MKNCILSDYILSQVSLNEFSIDEEGYNKAKELVELRIQGIIDKQTLEDKMKHLLRNLHPISLLESILDIQEDDNEAHKKNLIDPNTIRSWTLKEDHRLIKAIHLFGVDDWSDVVKFVGNGRTRAQCVQRWRRGLNPHLSKQRWTAEEEERLLCLVKKHGKNGWAHISRLLGNRSDVQCRYRYIQMKKDNKVPHEFDDSVLLPSAKSLKKQPNERSEIFNIMKFDDNNDHCFSFFGEPLTMCDISHIFSNEFVMGTQ